MIKRLIWTVWTLMSSVLKKADKLNLSLSCIEKCNIWVIYYFILSYSVTGCWRDSLLVVELTACWLSSWQPAGCLADSLLVVKLTACWLSSWQPAGCQADSLLVVRLTACCIIANFLCNKLAQILCDTNHTTAKIEEWWFTQKRVNWSSMMEPP